MFVSDYNALVIAVKNNLVKHIHASIGCYSKLAGFENNSARVFNLRKFFLRLVLAIVTGKQIGRASCRERV